MLTQYVLEISLDGNIVFALVAGSQIQPLIRAVQVAIGQQHRLSVICVVLEKSLSSRCPTACREDLQKAGRDGRRLEITCVRRYTERTGPNREAKKSRLG